MAYVPVPKDLTKVKTKVALNLTKRQIICFGSAAAVGVPFYIFTKPYIGTEISAICMVFIMLPFFFFAMYEKDGMHFEKIALNYIKVTFIYPKIRYYKTENMYDYIENKIEIDKEVLRGERKTKKKIRFNKR